MAGLFVKTLCHYREENKFLLHAFVVMPNHFHILITPTGITVERVVQFVKGGFSYRVKKELGLSTEIWERGYVDHRIRDGYDFDQHVIYIHQNPVVAGLVARPEDFLYSSAAPGANVDPRPLELQVSAAV